MVIIVMRRDPPAVRRAFASPLVAAGWFFAAVVPLAGLVRGPTQWAGWLVLGPAVGILLGSVAITKPGVTTRTHGALILAVSLLGVLMWSMTLAGAGGSLISVS
jgi:hypothetical protein